MGRKPANACVSAGLNIAAGRIHAKLAGLRTETAYKAGAARRVCHATRSRFRPAVKVNAEPVQGKFTFLSGEICPTYLGVGLARKPGPCMRKQLGVGQKSAEGIVLATVVEEGPNETSKYVSC